MASRPDFYNAVYSTAIGLGANDVQARLAAAQASEETGFGQSMVGNNLFGVKAGSNYTGPTVNAGTNEEYNGQMQRENANFRSYDDFTQSVADYLGVISTNFPDAWNAPTFSEAVKGLNTGVYGKYATNSDYGSHIKSIDNKYGAESYAQNPANVPVPTSPTDEVNLAGVPDDVTAFPSQPATPVDPEFAYAANPQNVPTPYAASDLSNNSLLSAFSEAPKTEDPFASVLGGSVPVTPALTPTVEGWSDMASAQPVQAPMDSVQASGILSGNPALEANARATAMMDVPASGVLSGNTPLDAATTASILSNATPADRMGVADPGFDNSRFDAAGPQVAPLDASRFSTPAKTDRIGALPGLTNTARMNPLTGVIDPATNTQSFMDQPAAPADLAAFSNAYAAQRGPTSGLLSADAMTVQGNAERQLAESIANRAAMPVSVPAGGILAGNQPLEAQATVPSLANAYTAPTAVTPAAQAIDNVTTGATTPGILSGSRIATASAPLSFTPSMGILAGQPVRQNQFVSSFPTEVAQNLIAPPTVNDVVAAPTLENIEIADQPTISSTPVDIPGPATTNALDQQKQQAVTNTMQAPQPTVQAAQNTKSFKDSVLSKETALGSILGSAMLGPPGAILGGVLGQQTAAHGGLTGLLGGGFAAPTTQIPGGVANIGGIYGGAFSPGTYATASNGARVGALGGGYTSYTSPSGVHEVISPTGQISHDFSKSTATV